jgi:multicomponent Na+:H+ antiporter subunit B
LVTSQIVMCIVKFLYPFTLLFGAYVVINGDLSPGGGFQGGAIIATAYLLTNFINSAKIAELNKLIKIEKYLFLTMIVIASLSILTRGEPFTNFMAYGVATNLKRFFLVSLNTLIGLKVAVGLIIIFTIFMREGR